MSTFNNKTILITGGTSGIGKAVAKEFLAEGAKVLITSRKKGNLDQTINELGGSIHGIQSDASSMDDLKELSKHIKEYSDTIDVLFVNAGFGKFSPIEEASEDFFDSQMNVLVKGGFFTVKEVLPLIKEGGTIVFNTSVVTDVAMPGASVYGAAKSAVQYLVKSFANEFKDRKIRVNAVSPGPIETNFFNEAGVPDEHQQQMAEQILSQVPMNRFGKPEEIAKTVKFLASEEASYITGHEIQVDGGMVQV
ncbi:SDR family oxidoreductase [Aquimarina sp. ERC-38]|uniref:SDR family oxidoreductase n=1 Tax=Aquimarina sp. ERC-38 TaxID=2949996 RepID=UPI002246B8C9|nr:SDR family oxidoreductase [Aquimarina sp. ERC-38]UZO80214.1 SDR family oxidoreductase [Aquimarina sp. ERC-38]